MRQPLNLAALRRESLNFVNFLIASKPIYKYVFAALFAGFLLGLLGPTYEFLVMRVSDVFSFRLWRILTCILVEPNLFLFSWSLLAVHQFFTYILPVWGLPEIIKFVAITQILTTLSICALGLLLFACFQALNLFYYVPVCGFTVASIGALVSLKQFLPDTVVLTTPYGRLKNGHLPLTALFFTSLFWFFGLLLYKCFSVCRSAGRTCAFSNLCRVLTVWVMTVSTLLGQGCHFHLFPRRMQPLTTLIASSVFSVLVVLRMRKKLKNVDAFHAFETLQSSLPESRDAERKRQKALRVLNERINLATAGQEKRMQSPAMDSIPSSPLLESTTSDKEVEMDELVGVSVINSSEKISSKQPA